MPSTAVKLVHVAVGVVCDADQRILIARRADHLHQGGLWEFPGGKVEDGETVQEALVRELREELAIAVATEGCRPLTEIHHDYGDKAVLLDVWWVREFSGEPQGAEGQPLQWVAANTLNDYPFPAANRAIIDAILQGGQRFTCPPLSWRFERRTYKAMYALRWGALIQINIPTQHAIVQWVTRNTVLLIRPRDKILIFALGRAKRPVGVIAVPKHGLLAAGTLDLKGLLFLSHDPAVFVFASSR